MASCPNCGRNTARTKDWCCQWCGYPLFSGSFKTINKTYKELKAERLAQETKKEEIEKITEEPVQKTPEPEKVIEPVKQETKTEVKLPEEKSVEAKSETETTAPESSPKAIRQVRRIVRSSESPVTRRIIRRRIPGRRGEEEIEEIVEYIDEVPETKKHGVTYSGYEDVSEDESPDEYGEQSDDNDEVVEYQEEPRVVQRKVQQHPVERRVAPEPRRERPARTEPAPAPKRPEPAKPVIRPRPEPKPELEVEEAEVSEDETLNGEPDVYNDDETVNEQEPAAGKPPVERSVIEPVTTPVMEQPSMEITADDIISAYETEGANADARYANKVLKITGIINKVDIREQMSVYALVLEATETNPLRQTVRCVFSREHGAELMSFVPAQKVTVQGKYDGSIINISMRNCSLIGKL